MSDKRRAKITDDDRRESARLKELWDSRPHRTQAEFGEHYKLGNQANVGHYLLGRSRLNVRAATAFAQELNCSVSDFSPRLAAEIEELAKSVRLTPPALVIQAAEPQPQYRVHTRPAIERALLSTLQGITGNKLKREYPVRSSQTYLPGRELSGGNRVDFAIVDNDDRPLTLIECKTFDASITPAHRATALAGQMWLLRHDMLGQRIEESPPTYMICMLENPGQGNDLSESELRLQATLRQLNGGGLIDGFTILRIIDAEEGQTQLHDLPGSNETLSKLLADISWAVVKD